MFILFLECVRFWCKYKNVRLIIIGNSLNGHEGQGCTCSEWTNMTNGCSCQAKTAKV